MNVQTRARRPPEGRRGKALSFISERGHVLLDVGCGPSDGESPYLAAADDVVLLDLNREFLVKSPNLDRTHPVVADATSLPIADECVDIVVATEVLEHVDSDEEMVSEIRRVVKPEGRLIITVPNRGVFGFLDPTHFCLARAGLKVIGRESQTIHRHYSVEEVRTVLGDDFVIERVSRTGSWATAICVLLVQFSKMIGSRRMQILCNTIGAYDYQLEYGTAAYNLAICAKRVGDKVHEIDGT